MKRIVLLIIIIFSLTGTKAQEKDSIKTDYRFTLEQCLTYAFGNNYTRQVMKLEEEAKADRHKQAKRERLPNLQGTVEEVYINNGDQYPATWNGNYNLETNVVLYKGGAIGNTIKRNELEKEQASYKTKQVDNNLTIEILKAFLTTLSGEELLKYEESILRASEEQLRQGKAQYDVGAILESDYLLLEAQFASDQSNAVDTRIARDNSLLALKSLLSMNPLETLEIVYPDTNSVKEMALFPSQKYVLDKAVNILPDLKISQYNIDIARMGIKLARANYLPTLTFGASVGNNDIPYNGSQFFRGFGQQVGVTLSVPIYDNSRTRSAVTQQRIEMRQAELNKKQTQLDLEQAIVEEYQSVVSFYNKYKASEISLNAYLKTYEVYRAKFNAGAITTVDLLQQQNNYINALNNFIQNKYGFILNRKILDVYMGETIKM